MCPGLPVVSQLDFCPRRAWTHSQVDFGERSKARRVSGKCCSCGMQDFQWERRRDVEAARYPSGSKTRARGRGPHHGSERVVRRAWRKHCVLHTAYAPQTSRLGQLQLPNRTLEGGRGYATNDAVRSPGKIPLARPKFGPPLAPRDVSTVLSCTPQYYAVRRAPPLRHLPDGVCENLGDAARPIYHGGGWLPAGVTPKTRVLTLGIYAPKGT
jgi:hypothetical protein